MTNPSLRQGSGLPGGAGAAGRQFARVAQRHREAIHHAGRREAASVLRSAWRSILPRGVHGISRCTRTKTDSAQEVII
jgi:hypothetical protein